MGCARCFIIVFVFLCLFSVHLNGKVFSRCELTRELLKSNYPKTFLSNWVCLIEQVSEKNTSAFTEKSSRRKYYGLFQIGSEWCKEGKRGGKCDISCETLMNDDIRDDAMCALKVFDTEGFKYWTKWETRCKGHRLPDIEKCPDFQYPPSNRASPARDKRTLRGRRSSSIKELQERVFGHAHEEDEDTRSL